MNIFRRLINDYYRWAMFLVTPHDPREWEAKRFVSELADDERDKLHELTDEYFWCKYCMWLYRGGSEVDIVDNERFACHDCLAKLRRCRR